MTPAPRELQGSPGGSRLSETASWDAQAARTAGRSGCGGGRWLLCGDRAEQGRCTRGPALGINPLVLGLMKVIVCQGCPSKSHRLGA